VRSGSRLDHAERTHYRDEGFVVRDRVFAPEELVRLRGAAEDVVARVAAHATRPGGGPEMRLGDGHRIQFSSRSRISTRASRPSGTIRVSSSR
jgi:hypothetical protein